MAEYPEKGTHFDVTGIHEWNDLIYFPPEPVELRFNDTKTVKHDSTKLVLPDETEFCRDISKGPHTTFRISVEAGKMKLIGYSLDGGGEDGED